MSLMIVVVGWLTVTAPSAGDPAPAEALAALGEDGGRIERPEPAYRHRDVPAPRVSPAAMQQSSDAPPSVQALPSFGAQGSMRWSIYAAIAAEFDDFDNRLGLAGVGWSYFLVDDLSIDLELNGLIINQSGKDPFGANFNVLLRWHILENDEQTWSVYVDGGAGVLLTSNDVPDDSASFNFTPQAGVGATYALSPAIRLFGGVRWLHISNANTYRSNSGRDHYELYLGLSFPF